MIKLVFVLPVLMLCFVQALSWSWQSSFDTDMSTSSVYPDPVVTDNSDEIESEISENEKKNCPEVPDGGMRWLLHVWDPDLGWKSETPRAVIAMAMNDWLNRSTVVVQEMELQLDLEITRSLLGSNFALNPTQLAMYIQALVALNRNPRDFHGLDLVADLLAHVQGKETIHPFIVLALCNAQAVTLDHLKAILEFTVHKDEETKRTTEEKSIALKALACAASFDTDLNKFFREKKRAAECIIMRQKKDGTFGNVYTTALAVQALISSDSPQSWNKRGALTRLREMDSVEQSVYGVYSVALALKADEYPFIKNLHPFAPFSAPRKSSGSRIHYTLRNDRRLDVEFTISINVPKGSTLFDVMMLSANEDANFKFSVARDLRGEPHVFAVGGVPNDAEENLYWRLCLQKRKTDHPNGSMLTTVSKAPTLEKIDPDHHLVLWYRDADCEVLNNRPQL